MIDDFKPLVQDDFKPETPDDFLADDASPAEVQRQIVHAVKLAEMPGKMVSGFQQAYDTAVEQENAKPRYTDSGLKVFNPADRAREQKTDEWEGVSSPISLPPQVAQVGEALQKAPVTGPILQGLEAAKNLGAAVGRDLGEYLFEARQGLLPSLENVKGWIGNYNPNQYRTAPTEKVATDILAEAGRFLPVAGLMTLGGAAGLTPATSGASAFAVSSAAEPGADTINVIKSAGLGAVLGPLTKSAEGLAARVLANHQIEAPVAKLAAQELANQAAQLSLLTAAESPELVNLYQTNPEEFKKEMLRIAGVNLALRAPHWLEQRLPQVRKDLAKPPGPGGISPEEYQRIFGKEPPTILTQTAPETAKELTKIGGEKLEEKGKEGLQVAEPTEAAPVPPPVSTPAEKPAPTETGPGMVGMGGATPAELEPKLPGGEPAVRVAVDDVNERLKRMGLEPILKPETKTDELLEFEFKQRTENDPGWPERLSEELTNNPRPLTDLETLAVNKWQVDTLVEYQRAAERFDQAVKDGREEDARDAGAQLAALEDKFTTFAEVNRVIGSEEGRAFRMRQMLMQADTSLAGITRRMRYAKNNEPLTLEEAAWANKLAEEIKVLQEQASKREADLQAERVAKEVAEAKLAAAPTYAPAVLEAADRFVSRMEKKAKGFLDDLLRSTSTIGPDLLAKLAYIGAAKIARLGLDAVKWADEMRRELAGWKQIGEVDWDKTYEESKKLLDQELAGEEKKTPKVTRAVKKLDAEEKVAAATSEIAGKINKNDELYYAVKKLVAGFLEQGTPAEWRPIADKVQAVLRGIKPDWDFRDTLDLISGYGRFSPLSKDAIKTKMREVKAEALWIRKMQDLIAKLPLEKTGPERPKMTGRQRRMQQIANELKKRFGIVVTDPATQLASALESRKRYYDNRIEDLQQEIETRQRIVRQRTAPPTDAELDAKIAEYRELKAERDEIFGGDQATLLARAEKAEQRKLLEWEARLARAEKGDFSAESRETALQSTSVRLEQLRSEVEARRARWEELRELANPKPDPAAIALARAKATVAWRLREANRRLVQGDLRSKPKQRVEPDTQLIGLQARLLEKNKEIRKRLAKMAWEEKTKLGKAWALLLPSWDISRLLMTTGEFSHLLRQGKMSLLSHWSLIPKSIWATLKSFGLTNERGEKFARELEARMRMDREAWAAAQRAKLFIADEDAAATRQEETIIGDWSEKTWGVRNFTRATRVALNYIRWEHWNLLRRTLAPDGRPTAAEDRMIAMFVNEATGRGTLSRSGEPAAAFLARVMFSPRFLASRIQMVTGHSLWGRGPNRPTNGEPGYRQWLRDTARARKVVATEYARILGGYIAYYGLLSLLFKIKKAEDEDATINLDSRSSDFLKFRIGNFRVDPLAGLQQISVLVRRIASGEVVDSKGKVQSIRGSDIKWGGRDVRDVLNTFAWTKAHPTVNTIVDLLSGRDIFKRPVALSDELMQSVHPITYGDMWKAGEELGLPRGILANVLLFLGEGGGVQEPQPMKIKKPRM